MPPDAATSNTARPTMLDEFRAEATAVAKTSGKAVASLAWLWPLRGVIYTIMRKAKQSPVLSLTQS